MHITFESDLLQTPETRALRASLGLGEPAALHILWKLWCELALATRSSGRLGFVSTRQLPFLLEQLGQQPAVTAADLVEAGFLTPTEGGHISRPFIGCNPGLDPTKIRSEVLANRIGHIRRTVAVADRESTQMSLLIPGEWYGDAKPEEVRQIHGLIRAFDAVLRRPARVPGDVDYSRPLIRDALAAIRSTGPDNLLHIAEAMVQIRDHPAIPQTTEAILSQIDTIKSLDRMQDILRRPRRKIPTL